MRYNHLDMLPEKAFSPVGKRMTLEGGGGSSGGGTQTSTTKAEIDPLLKPYISYGLGEAQKLYQGATPKYYQGQTYVSPSAATQTALQSAQNRAIAGSPLLPAAQQQQQDVIQGAYLQNNPYFNQAMGGASQAAQQSYYDAIKQAQGGASMAGRYGSNVSADLQNRAANTMSNTLVNKAGELAYTNYAAERARQDAASGAAPTLANADYTDINQLLKTGQAQEGYQQQALQSDINKWNYEQNLPYAKLSNYLGSVYGSPSGQVATTQSTSSGGGKIVCTMMNESYGIGSFRNRVWIAQSARMPHAKTVEKGYHTLFLPLVAFAKGKGILNRMVKHTLEHIAKHRTADVYKEMRNGKRDTLGRIYRAVLEPLCYVVGRMKGY
jgi:hypothetical protein